jgi:hypothetical protein
MSVRPEAVQEARILGALFEGKKERVEEPLKKPTPSDAAVERVGCGETTEEGGGRGEEEACSGSSADQGRIRA